MKKYSDIIWGLALIAIGIIIGGNSIGLFDIDLFFDGWWTLFIIVPCFFGFITNDDKTGDILGIILGVLLLLSAQDVISYDTLWKLALPIILIVIGLSIIFKNAMRPKLNSKNGSKSEVMALFSGQNVKPDKMPNGDIDLNAIFGGVSYDLRDLNIKNDIEINALAIFGGVEIFAPNEVKVIIKSTSIFGGSTDKRKTVSVEKDSKVIYINAVAIFGGITVK